MVSKTLSLLKFVGTVSLGLLTGTSVTLSTLTVPSLLALPSASSAAKSFRSLADTATTQLRTLATVSGTAFLAAFALSPRGARHPYLLYTSLFCFSTQLADYATPLIFGNPSSSTGPSHTHAAAQRRAARKEKHAARRMEASYEVVGDSHSDEGAASASGDEHEHEEDFNGEEVRGEMEGFMKSQLVQATVSAVGFAMAIVGIWGDGVHQVFSTETVVIEL